MVGDETDSERRRRERAELADTRERDRLSFEHAPIGQALVGLDGTWLSVNPALCELLGVDAPTLRHLTFQDVTHPEDLDTDLALLTQLVAGEIPNYRMEKRYCRPDGRIVWAMLHVSLVRDVDGAPRYFVSQIQDVTERHLRDAELHRISEALVEREAAAVASEARYRALVDHLPDTVSYVYDRAHRIAVASGLGPVRRGYDEDALVGRRPEDLVGTTDATRVHHFLDEAFAGRPVSAEIETETTGREYLVDVVALPPERGGPPSEALFVARDITERKARERAVAAAEARYSALVEHSADLTTIVSADGLLGYASPAYEVLTGRPLATAIGTALIELVHPDDAERVAATLAAVTAEPGSIVGYPCRLLHDDGTWRHIEVVATNRLDDPAVSGLVINARDVTERVDAAERLAHQAMHDVLTDLPNRALLLDRLEQALARAERRGTPCALLFIDLDRFKGVNDSLGHAAGDQVLIAVADRLQTVMRPEDSVARLGGDEFVVLAEHLPDAETAVSIANRIREVVTRPIGLEGHMVTVGCSVGIAISEHHRPETLLQEADTALYRAKERGRNRSELYDQAMQVQARRRLDTEQVIRTAIDEGGITVLYQPIIDLATGEMTGTEALARITPRHGQMVGAGDFIPVAEDTGLIVPLGAAVLEAACAQQARWSENDTGPRHVSVNVSARQLLSSGLVDLVERTMVSYGLHAGELCLELTESALIDAGPSMRKNIDALKDLGVMLALDDFGTGWSSLAYLRRFPLDVVKIDRSFVTGLGTDDDDTEVVKAIISLGHALGLTTVAEGVEEATHEKLLIELGCDRAQGYRYGRPQYAADVDVLRSTRLVGRAS